MNFDFDQLECHEEWDELDVSIIPNKTSKEKDTWHIHHQQLTHLAGEGHTCSQIAKTLGLSRQRVSILLKKYNIVLKNRYNRSTVANSSVHLIRVYAHQGLTPKEVAHILQFSEECVNDIAKRYCVVFRDQPNIVRTLLG